MTDFWQGAGGASAFNTRFEDNSNKIRGRVNTKNRTIGILSFIGKNQPVSIKDTFNGEIRDYLYQEHSIVKNETVLGHLYKPAQFFGFIQENKNAELLLSLEGSLFLENYNTQNFTKCKQIFINQLDNATYPNPATPKSKNLNLFPFRILFKLLLENTNLTQDFINESLVHITAIEDLSSYLISKDLNDIQSYPSEHKETNFNDWIIKALVSIEILDRDDNRDISINANFHSYLKSLYGNIEYENFFFKKDSLSCELNNQVAKQRYPRDAKLILQAKQRDNYKCSINHQHTTFISKEKNYVEGHHIVPMFQQKNYGFKLDDVNNITSLCPNCHREIHSADDRKDILTKLYQLNNQFMQSNNVNLIDLYKMYSCA